MQCASAPGVRRIYPSTLDTYRFPSPFTHVNTVTMSELIITSSAYYINGDSSSPMTSLAVRVANTVAMTTSGLAVHTLQPHIFFRLWAHSPRRDWSATPSKTLLTFAAAWPLGKHTETVTSPYGAYLFIMINYIKSSKFTARDQIERNIRE